MKTKNKIHMLGLQKQVKSGQVKIDTSKCCSVVCDGRLRMNSLFFSIVWAYRKPGGGAAEAFLPATRFSLSSHADTYIGRPSILCRSSFNASCIINDISFIFSSLKLVMFSIEKNLLRERQLAEKRNKTCAKPRSTKSTR